MKQGKLNQEEQEENTKIEELEGITSKTETKLRERAENPERSNLPGVEA